MFPSLSRHGENPASPAPQENKTPVLAAQNGATVIARGVKLEGDFVSQGDVVIDGEVRGKVLASGKLTVGSEAVIHADVTADDAVISGVIQGNITAKGQVVLHATARVTGDLVGERMMMESGATLEGRVQVGPKKAEEKGEEKKEEPKPEQPA